MGRMISDEFDTFDHTNSNSTHYKWSNKSNITAHYISLRVKKITEPSRQIVRYWSFVHWKKMEDEEKIVNLKNYHCYPLKDHECYFNWIDENFDEVIAKQRIEKRQYVVKCEETKECNFCSFNGEWRSTVEPKLFLNQDDDDDEATNEGLLHYFVSWNGEMVFLEAFVGEHDKAEDRLNYLMRVIECSEHQGVDYLEGYIYICKTLQTFIKFCKCSLDRSELASLPIFNDLSLEAQIGVLSLKFVFYKDTSNNMKIQIQVLRKVSHFFRCNLVLKKFSRCINSKVSNFSF